MIPRTFRVRYFLSNLLLLLGPLLIPLVILGTFTIGLSETYIKDTLTKGNRNILAQSQKNLGLMLSTLDQVSFLLDTDDGVVSFFDSLFTTEDLSYTGVRTKNLINGFLSSLTLSKAFVHSIYVSFPNPRGYFYATGYGRVTPEEIQDQGWVRDWEGHRTDRRDWTEKRTIPAFPGGEGARPIISIFHPLAGVGGLVLLNLYPEGLGKVWDGLELSPGQQVLVLNREGQILLSSHKDLLMSPEDLRSLVLGGVGAPQDIIVSQVTDDRFGWILLSLTPRQSLYSLSVLLSTVTLLLLLVSFLAGLALTANTVRINFNQVQTIAETLESAREGRPLPPLPQQVGTVFEQISHGILTTFLETSYLRLQLSEKTALARLLELESRQNQMNPHFLLNTMKTIYWKTFGLTATPNEACAMIDNLSDILEYALRTPTEAVTLGDEVRTAKSYLAIQEVRYAGQFRTLWDVPVPFWSIRVPKLLLQPLLENAIYHGARNAGRPCGILVRARRVDATLELSVTDTGVGLTPEGEEELNRRMAFPPGESHIGLANTQRRIRLVFGPEWGLTLRGRPGRGTTVRIRLPAGGMPPADGSDAV